MRQTICFVLTLTFLFAMSLPALAALVPTVSVIHQTAFCDYEGNAAINPEQTLPEDEIIIPLMPKGFEDENGAIIVWNQDTPDLGPNIFQARAAFRVNFKMMVGRDIIRDIDFVKYTPTRRVRAQSAIRIRFVEDYDSTMEKEYRFKVRFTLKDDISTGIEEVFGGMMYNLFYDTQGGPEADLGYKYIVSSADESASDVTMDLGSGVSVLTDMVKGEKYYGYANIEPNEGQDAVLEAYPEIYDVYFLKTINIKHFGNNVTFTNRDDLCYVYNVRGEFAGMSNQPVAYSTRYYLSKTPLKINMDLLPEQLEVEEEPTPVITEALARFMGQGKVLPTNA